MASNDTPASNNHRGFAGYIDEARVYDETLTAADVVEIRDATAPTVPEEEWLSRDSGRAATIGRFRFAGQLASEHFVIKWGTGLPANMQPVGTYIQQNLNRLEMSWDIIVEQSGMAPPKARNGITYKINVYVLDTGLWFVDAGGGTFSGACRRRSDRIWRDVRFAVGTRSVAKSAQHHRRSLGHSCQHNHDAARIHPCPAG